MAVEYHWFGGAAKKIERALLCWVETTCRLLVVHENDVSEWLLHPLGRVGLMSSAHSSDRSTALDFASAVRVIGATLQRMGFSAPVFRSPPRILGVDRSIRRRTGGDAGASAVVAVRVKDRPWPAVVADLVEGVVAVNSLASPEADRVRAALWAELEPLCAVSATTGRRVA